MPCRQFGGTRFLPEFGQLSRIDMIRTLAGMKKVAIKPRREVAAGSADEDTA